MATASDILRVAAEEVGYSRWDDNQAGTKYGRWYANLTGSSYFGQSGVPYCMMFVSWVFNACNQSVKGLPIASCQNFYDTVKNSGLVLSNKKNAQPGDIVLYQWDSGKLDHVGIVEKNCGSYIQAIEGNTTGPDGRSGAVARRTRDWKYIPYVVRPQYTSSSSGSTSGTIAEKKPLHGIDISHYQSGINLSNISYDFVICKATEGVDYIDKTCDGFIQKTKSMGKLWGFYHFMDKSDPVAQADFFVDNCTNYFGEGIPVLDYEMYGRIGTDGAKKFLDRVYERTKVRCIVYMSRSVCVEEDWSKIAVNHALWLAQYANNNTTGYQTDPWQSGSMGAWKSCAIHQYTSHGRLSGYSGNLDLDIAYMTPTGWKKFAMGDRGGEITPTPTPEPTPSEETIELGDTRYWGPKFTRELQKQLGTEQDGIVSRQPKSNKKYVPCAETSSWQFTSNYKGGSAMVKALQRKVGTDADGWFGKNTAKAVQKYLNNHGFSVGSSGVDGSFGPDSCQALGRAIQAKLFQ